MADRVVTASDHAGLSLRAEAVKAARARGFEVEDLGPNAPDSVDYPDFAEAVARAVAEGRARFGILVCGTGIGMAMAANKIPGVRAAICRTEWEARMTRAHNDANVLCLGERVTGGGLGVAIVEAFLATPFEGGRHQRRVDKLNALDRR
ncbi:MAG: ribose 5-phosphate isomerase B [Anaeromyxobacteraceae bacterium]|nr:ribose 5-phosphate isomerase B [Anaeromyxobacteraceae bacterium]